MAQIVKTVDERNKEIPKFRNMVNGVSISYKRKVLKPNNIRTSEDIEAFARQIYKKSNAEIDLKEYMFLILLNRANYIIGYYKLGEGGITGVSVDTRICFSVALKSLATSIILVHNHPSGNLNPSQADCTLTKSIQKAGKLFDIFLLDHVILTSESYFSFADQGLL